MIKLGDSKSLMRSPSDATVLTEPKLLSSVTHTK
jgi:hypothetical protein